MSTEFIAERLCLITGGTQGIGFATAEGLARRGAQVIIAGRSETRGRRAAQRIGMRTGGRVDYMVLDLSSLSSVKDFASAFVESYGRLHILIHNAAVVKSHRTLTSDGYEMQFATNHLGPFFLTYLLLPTLIACAPSRIIAVASAVESWGRIDFTDLHGARNYDRLRAYCQSKLANVMFTYELARRLGNTPVTVNCLHPGVVATRLLQDFSGQGYLRRWSGLVWKWLQGRLPLSPSKGAQTSIYLATSPEVEYISGRYFMNERPAQSSPQSRDPVTAQRLWEVSENLTGICYNAVL